MTKTERLKARVSLLENILCDVWSVLRCDGKLTDTNIWEKLDELKECNK